VVGHVPPEAGGPLREVVVDELAVDELVGGPADPHLEGDDPAVDPPNRRAEVVKGAAAGVAARDRQQADRGVLELVVRAVVVEALERRGGGAVVDWRADHDAVGRADPAAEPVGLAPLVAVGVVQRQVDVSEVDQARLRAGRPGRVEGVADRHAAVAARPTARGDPDDACHGRG